MLNMLTNDELFRKICIPLFMEQLWARSGLLGLLPMNIEGLTKKTIYNFFF